MRVETGLVPDQTSRLPELNHCSLRGEVDPARTCWRQAAAAAATRGKAQGARGHAALSWGAAPLRVRRCAPPITPPAPSEGGGGRVASASWSSADAYGTWQRKTLSAVTGACSLRRQGRPAEGTCRAPRCPGERVSAPCWPCGVASRCRAPWPRDPARPLPEGHPGSQRRTRHLPGQTLGRLPRCASAPAPGRDAVSSGRRASGQRAGHRPGLAADRGRRGPPWPPLVSEQNGLVLAQRRCAEPPLSPGSSGSARKVAAYVSLRTVKGSVPPAAPTRAPPAPHTSPRLCALEARPNRLRDCQSSDLGTPAGQLPGTVHVCRQQPPRTRTPWPCGADGSRSVRTGPGRRINTRERGDSRNVLDHGALQRPLAPRCGARSASPPPGLALHVAGPLTALGARQAPGWTSGLLGRDRGSLPAVAPLQHLRA